MPPQKIEMGDYRKSPGDYRSRKALQPQAEFYSLLNRKAKNSFLFGKRRAPFFTKKRLIETIIT